MWRRSPRLRFYSRQHSLEGDFDELFRKGQSRHTDQGAGALRSCRAVGLLAHLARGGECGVDIEDIERLLDDPFPSALPGIRKWRCWHQQLDECPPDEAEIHAVSMACRTTVVSHR